MVQKHVKTILETLNELSIVGDAITDEDKVSTYSPVCQNPSIC